MKLNDGDKMGYNNDKVWCGSCEQPVLSLKRRRHIKGIAKGLLISVFMRSPTPTQETLSWLCFVTGLSVSRIRMWFKNLRYRWRRRLKDLGVAPHLHSDWQSFVSYHH